MTVPATAKQDPHGESTLQPQKPLQQPFNLMGLSLELRLMVYEEAFREIHPSESPGTMDGSHAVPNDHDSGGDSDDSDDPNDDDDSSDSDYPGDDAPNDHDSSSESSDSGDSNDVDDSSDSDDSSGSDYQVQPDDRGESHDAGASRGRLKLKDKLGLPLASKMICAESLPILYKTHHFKISIWKTKTGESECCRGGPPTEDVDVFRYYFLRRSPTLVGYMTHLEIFFDDSYIKIDSCEDGEQALAVNLLQDIAAACSKLKTLRFSMFVLPHGWEPHFDLGNNPQRDTAVDCFRAFAKNGCSLEFQVLVNNPCLKSFLNDIAPLNAKHWSLENRRNPPGDWNISEEESIFDLDNCSDYYLYGLSALTYQRIQEGLSSEEYHAEEWLDVTSV